MSHIIVRTAKPGESKHANEVIHRSFNSMGAHGDPFPPDNHIVLAELDGKLVGHTSIRPFKFHLGTGVVTGNALHMVGTDPGYQHRGIGHAMMDKVIEISRASNHVFSVLETPVPRFYAMKGWELIGPRYGITIDRASLQSSASRHEPSRPGVTLEDVTPDDLPGLLLLREGFGSEKWLFSWANDIYMARLHEEHAPGVARFFHKILDGGRLVGYLYGNRDTSTEPGKPLGITVLEWIMDGAYAHSIKDVLGHLLSFDDEFSTIFVKFKIDPWMEDAIVNLGGKVTGASGNVQQDRSSQQSSIGARGVAILPELQHPVLLRDVGKDRRGGRRLLPRARLRHDGRAHVQERLPAGHEGARARRHRAGPRCSTIGCPGACLPCHGQFRCRGRVWRFR